jgi:hypothetical protein
VEANSAGRSVAKRPSRCQGEQAWPLSYVFPKLYCREDPSYLAKCFESTVCHLSRRHQYQSRFALCATNAIRAAPNPLPSFASPIRILCSPSSPISGISLKASLM